MANMRRKPGRHVCALTAFFTRAQWPFMKTRKQWNQLSPNYKDAQFGLKKVIGLFDLHIEVICM